jgi:ribosomal protein L17
MTRFDLSYVLLSLGLEEGADTNAINDAMERLVRDRDDWQVIAHEWEDRAKELRQVVDSLADIAKQAAAHDDNEAKWATVKS